MDIDTNIRGFRTGYQQTKILKERNDAFGVEAIVSLFLKYLGAGGTENVCS